MIFLTNEKIDGEIKQKYKKEYSKIKFKMQVDWNVNISNNFEFKQIADILFQHFV